MYPKFIEVHHRYLGDGDKTKCTVNIDHIVCFEGSVIYTNQKEKPMILVAESYEEVKTLIEDSGCLIKKADPRLDIEHPLTMNDLRTMVGEPVWNSNTGKWGLVKEVREDDVTLVYEAADWVIVGREDLKKFPLYRIRK